MRGRLTITLTIALLAALLVALNAVSYVRVEPEPDLELTPDRSTNNTGATGTRALYDYLAESGRQVVRWRESPAALSRQSGAARPGTFVVVGALRVKFKPEEASAVLQWVRDGGRLVLIDRRPDVRLLPPGAGWQLIAEATNHPAPAMRADDDNAMTAGADTIAPTQPTRLSGNVERVAPSRFAARLRVVPAGNRDKADGEDTSSDEADGDEADGGELPPPPKPTMTPAARLQPLPPTAAHTQPSPSPTLPIPGTPAVVQVPEKRDAAAATGADDEATPTNSAPVFHFGDEQGALVADYALGSGRIIVIGDPYLVANAGLSRADNLALALNVLGDASGLIAFDEFHQGRGEVHNQVLHYFAGTPVVALAAQLLLLTFAVVWTRGQRFARSLPAPRVDRRSKLEFVASLAELQQRARAYDLALENVYGRTRRALARYGGTHNEVPRAQIAAAVAARSGLDAEELTTLMKACEDAINGAPLTAMQALTLVAALRELERRLGIRLRAREIKQAARR